MSWHYSRALVAEYSAGIFSDGAASAPLSTTTMPEAFSSHGKTTDASRRSRSGMTFAPLTDAHGEALLTLFRADSRAKTLALLAKEPELPEPDPGFGAKWRALLVKFSPSTFGWRTARCLWEEDLDWSCLTLPRWGSLHDGELWERTTPEHHTSETGFGCWPTPKASAAGPDFAAVDRGKSISLQTAVAIFPTPTAQNASNNGSASQYRRNSLPLDAVIGGALNPTWVEWLMGWPLGWTDCAASATDRFRKWCNAHGRS